MRTKLILTIISMLLVFYLPISAADDDGETILTKMMQGNTRYVAGESVFPNLSGKRRAQTAEGGQHPYATVISCSDSRVPVEAIFDAGIGDIFVIRVAGNVCKTDEIGSIEYGVEHLGTPVMLVLGHEQCGAVTAVLTDAEVHGSIPALVAPIGAAVEKVKADYPDASKSEQVAAAVRENVMVQMKLLLKGSPGVADRVREGQTLLVGGVYDLESGKVTILGQHPRQEEILDSGTDTQPGH